jgi:hypothetical protein
MRNGTEYYEDDAMGWSALWLAPSSEPVWLCCCPQTGTELGAC